MEENRKDIVLVGFDMADITVQIIQNPDYLQEHLCRGRIKWGILVLLLYMIL